MNILEVKGLCKEYKKGSPVLKDLNLSIPKGKIVGLLGPNGCGKSTLVKMVAGVLQATSGEILVDGNSIGEKTKAIVSYLPERTYFTANMKVHDLITFFSDFYADFDSNRAYALMNDLGVDITKPLKNLSKGTKEKVQLIMVMSRNAKLYLLDEPIAGVDPAAREYIINTVLGNYNREATIIITTHLITDVEDLLDEFVFLTFGGKILKSGNVKAQKEETGKTLDELFREVFRCSVN